jgi:hypothetical protein
MGRGAGGGGMKVDKYGFTLRPTTYDPVAEEKPGHTFNLKVKLSLQIFS